MKTNKKTTKTVKTVKPVFTVDITECETINDLILAFAEAKMSAGVAINETELLAIIENEINNAVCDCVEEMFGSHNALYMHEDGTLEAIDLKEYRVGKDENLNFKNGVIEVKKPNIFKRFWNWITRKK